jgi:hypothetical protein
MTNVVAVTVVGTFGGDFTTTRYSVIEGVPTETNTTMAPAQIEAECEKGLEAIFTAVAAAKGYGYPSILDYAGDPNSCPGSDTKSVIKRQFISEGNAFKQWRMAMWASGIIYQMTAIATNTPPASIQAFTDAVVADVGMLDLNGDYTAWLANTPVYNG